MTSPRSASPRSTTPTQHPRKCAVDGCEAVNPRGARYCANHYKQAWVDRTRPPRCGTWRRSQAEVDPMVVERLVAGDLPEFYTAHERREAVRELRRQGYCYREIAERLGTYPRKVHRDLCALGLVGVAS